MKKKKQKTKIAEQINRYYFLNLSIDLQFYVKHGIIISDETFCFTLFHHGINNIESAIAQGGKTMARDFMTVYKKILAVAPKELVDDLEKYVMPQALELCVESWVPEVVWQNFYQYVTYHVAPCSKNPQSIAIYAETFDSSFADMKSKFEKDGL